MSKKDINEASLTLPELADLAREIRRKEGLTQVQAASRLSGKREVDQSHVSRAERGQEKYASLAVRMVKELGGFEVRTVYHVCDPKSEPNGNDGQ